MKTTKKIKLLSNNNACPLPHISCVFLLALIGQRRVEFLAKKTLPFFTFLVELVASIRYESIPHPDMTTNINTEMQSKPKFKNICLNIVRQKMQGSTWVLSWYNPRVSRKSSQGSQVTSAVGILETSWSPQGLAPERLRRVSTADWLPARYSK